MIDRRRSGQAGYPDRRDGLVGMPHSVDRPVIDCCLIRNGELDIDGSVVVLVVRLRLLVEGGYAAVRQEKGGWIRP